MDQAKAWRAIDAHRVNLTALLDDLTPDEWSRPSLCDGWTVRDVVGHLAFQQSTVWEQVKAVGLARGGMNRIIHDSAVRYARRPTGQLVGEVRALVGKHRPVRFTTYQESLIDVMVHSQDIVVPLGRPLPIPVEAAAGAATRVWTTGWPWRAARTFAGHRFVATDTDWSVGEGHAVEGPMASILLLLTGRTAAVPALAGRLR
jgi:uncharacterized protein (TIGR03083 family)